MKKIITIEYYMIPTIGPREVYWVNSHIKDTYFPDPNLSTQDALIGKDMSEDFYYPKCTLNKINEISINVKEFDTRNPHYILRVDNMGNRILTDYNELITYMDQANKKGLTFTVESNPGTGKSSPVAGIG